MSCHTEEAAEWHRSEHRTSFSDPVFQRALALEPSPFCVGCHAPEGSGSEPARAELGVACVTCHLAGEVVLAAPKATERPAPHAIERRAEFAAQGACAGCHEFSFGDDARRPAPLPMQRTITEHARSPLASTTCAECHMPHVPGASGPRRGHAFADTRDPAWLRRSLRATAARLGATGARVTLSLSRVGHAFPTGDLFRRLALRVDALDERGVVVASAARTLSRRFGTVIAADGGPIRVELSDDRPGAAGPQPDTIVDLDPGLAARGASLRWTVALERVLHAADGREADAIVAGVVPLAEGELPPLPTAR